jgi:hypothetical protein
VAEQEQPNEAARQRPEEEAPGSRLLMRQPEYECYSDSAFFGHGSYTFQIIFGVQETSGTKPLALVRLSPEHAKILAIMLKRQIKEWEAQRNLPIPIAAELLQERGIKLEEEW